MSSMNISLSGHLLSYLRSLNKLQITMVKLRHQVMVPASIVCNGDIRSTCEPSAQVS